MKFKITDGKGFYWGFINGWGLSVQFGYGNYADNYNCGGFEENVSAGKTGSNQAEIAIITPDGDLFPHPDFDGDTVGGYRNSDDVFKYLEFAKNQPGEKEETK